MSINLSNSLFFPQRHNCPSTELHICSHVVFQFYRHECARKHIKLGHVTVGSRVLKNPGFLKKAQPSGFFLGFNGFY